MPANYFDKNGTEFSWKTGQKVASELIERDKRDNPEGYGKKSAGDDFFLSYPLKRNSEEDSLILQAVKYLPPNEELGEGMGMTPNKDYEPAYEALEGAVGDDGNVLTDLERHKKVTKDTGKFIKGLSMGSGMDSRYVGFAGDKHNAKTKFYVELPIPNELSDSQSVTWDASTMNAFEVVAASVAMGAMQDPAATAEQVQIAIDSARQATMASDFGMEDGGAIGGAVRAALAGLSLKSFGSNVTPNSMISRASGKILNSNKELLFEGVNLRTFNFNVTFASRSKDESTRVMKIIRSLKTSMAAKAGDEYIPGAGNYKGTGGIFLNAPDIFLLKYLHKGEEHPFLNKFKPCALTTFNVNYTGANVWSSYKDGTPTLIKCQMQFSEMNPIYAEDYSKSGKGVGY